MTRKFGVAFLFLAMSFGCRMKEVAPPVVVEPPPHNMIHLDQPVVVNSGDDQAAGTAPGQTGATTGTAAAADETARRKRTSERAAEQRAPAPKVVEEGTGRGIVAATESAKPAQAEPTDKTRPARTRKSRHERAAGTAVAAALKPVPAAPATAAASTEATTAHATLNFKNDAGGDFKLVDARFLMDGADLPSAITSAERGKTYQVFSGDIGVGQHMVTARLTYQGATHGVFTYMNGYSFKVRSDEMLTLRSGHAATFTIICNEKKGLNQPADKRLVVSLEEHGASGGGP